MIPLKINGKKYRVPVFDELTVKQYLDYKKMLDKKKAFNIIDYLSVVLDIDYKTMYFSKVKNLDLIFNALGAPRDYTKISPKKQFIIDGDIYNLESYSIETVGQRFMIQENGKKFKDNEEFFSFVLAVCVEREVNLTKVMKLKDKILNENYLEVLPTAFFLLKNLLPGLSKGRKFFQQLRRLMSMK